MENESRTTTELRTEGYIHAMLRLVEDARDTSLDGVDEKRQCAIMAVCRETGQTKGGGLRYRSEIFAEGSEEMAAIILADFAEKNPGAFAKAVWLVNDRRRKANIPTLDTLVNSLFRGFAPAGGKEGRS